MIMLSSSWREETIEENDETMKLNHKEVLF